MLACILREMTGQPKAKRDDRTSLLVGVGMTALLTLGVVTVFGDAIAAVFAPPPAPSPSAAPQAVAASSTVSPAPSAPPSSTASSDGGGSKS